MAAGPGMPPSEAGRSDVAPPLPRGDGAGGDDTVTPTQAINEPDGLVDTGTLPEPDAQAQSDAKLEAKAEAAAAAEEEEEEADPIRAFYQHFQTRAAELRARIDDDSSSSTAAGAQHLSHCQAALARLASDVKDASSYVPAYDLRGYAEALGALGARLAAARRGAAPRGKFAFKARLGGRGGAKGVGPGQGEKGESDGGDGPGSAVDVAGGVADGHTAGSGSGSTAATTASQPGQQRQTQGVVISGRRAERVTLPLAPDASPSLPPAATTATLADIDGCVVDLTATQADSHPTPSRARITFASMQMRDIRRSLVVTGRVGGPAHITALRGCAVAVACGQFRMHGCVGVDVYLECGSRPIIEDCENVRFAPLPRVLRGAEGFAPLAGPGQGAEAAVNKDLWDQVDDFKWLRAEPSPHWRVLPEGDRLRDEVWTRLVTTGPEEFGVEVSLQAAGLTG